MIGKRAQRARFGLYTALGMTSLCAEDGEKFSITASDDVPYNCRAVNDQPALFPPPIYAVPEELGLQIKNLIWRNLEVIRVHQFPRSTECPSRLTCMVGGRSGQPLFAGTGVAFLSTPPPPLSAIPSPTLIGRCPALDTFSALCWNLISTGPQPILSDMQNSCSLSVRHNGNSKFPASSRVGTWAGHHYIATETSLAFIPVFIMVTFSLPGTMLHIPSPLLNSLYFKISA